MSATEAIPDPPEPLPYANAIPGGAPCAHWITASRPCRRRTRVEYIYEPGGTVQLCATHAPRAWR